MTGSSTRAVLNCKVDFVEFPSEFSQEARARVIAAEIKAARRLREIANRPIHSLALAVRNTIVGQELPVREHLMAVFSAFSSEACNLGRKGIWGVDTIDVVTREFLKMFAKRLSLQYRTPRYRIPEMVSEQGDLLSGFQLEVESTEEWSRYQDDLSEVAQLQAGLGGSLRVAAGARASGVDRPDASAKGAEAHSKHVHALPRAADAGVGIVIRPGVHASRQAQYTHAPEKSSKAKRLPRLNARYEAINKALAEIAAARPKNHEEVFRFLDDRKVLFPNRKPFKPAGGWLKGFQQNQHAASAWLSQVWGRLELPAFARGPKK